MLSAKSLRGVTGSEARCEDGVKGCSPNSQNATQTLGSAPLKTAANLDLYIAQDPAGDPGRGSMLLSICCMTLHRWTGYSTAQVATV